MSTPRVLLIGWDAADWSVAGPLMDAGEMPHLARLVDEGVMGNLASLTPMLSPMLWTSIATGKHAFKHGIHGFAEPDPVSGGVRPITTLSRKTKAIWNVLGQNGLRSNVVGWWPSHPAEPIRGVMVSNHFQQARAAYGEPWPTAPGTVHPADLEEKLAPLRVHPTELEAEQLLAFVPRAAELDLEKDPRLGSAAKVLAETASVHAAATALIQLEPWDFMAVYFDGIDHFCHGFMRYHPPRLDWVSEHDFEMYHDVVNSAYRFHDLMLGAYLRLVDDDTTVILISDHGFHSDHLRPKVVSNEPAGPADEHRPFGVFAMKGPGIRRDELVFGARLLDVAPTILTLFGLPVGEDMDGRPLTEAFVEPPKIATVESWDAVVGDDGLPLETQVDSADLHESIEQLVELGYLEKPDEDEDVAVRRTVRELRYNLARSYMGAHRFPDAAELLEALWDEFPDESRFGIKLFECRLTLERSAEARQALERLAREKARYADAALRELKDLAEADRRKSEAGEQTELDPAEAQRRSNLRRRAAVNHETFAYLRGRLSQVEERHEQALEAFEQASGADPHFQPTLRLRIGESLFALGRTQEALRSFREALDADPVNPQVRLGIGLCLLVLDRPQEALEEASAAAGLAFQSPQAHFLRGRALARLGRTEEAVEAYRAAVQRNPVFPEAHRRLADLLRTMNDKEAAAEHDRRAVAAEERIAAFRLGEPLPEDARLEDDVDLQEAVSVGDFGGAESLGPLPDDAVVVVSGLPRSGTSMMMQMLVAGGLPALTDDARPADESNPNGYYELEAVKALTRDPGALKGTAGKAVKVVAPLLPALPQGPRYRIVYMERPLGEILASQAAMLERGGGAQSRSRDRRLASTYRKQVEQVGRLLQANAERLAVLTVGYRDALASPETTARRVNEFLGGGLDEVAMAGAVDRRLHRLRRS